MASALEIPAIREQAALFSVSSYHKLILSGVISAETELLEGVVVDKMTKSYDHNYFTNALFEAMRKIVPAGMLVLKESSLTLIESESEPEPDLMVVAGPLSRYKDKNPQTAAFIVEVAKSSLGLDRAKASVYSRAGIDVYCIVDIDAKNVEFYEKPGVAGYQTRRDFSFKDRIPFFESHLVLETILDG